MKIKTKQNELFQQQGLSEILAKGPVFIYLLSWGLGL